MDEKLQEIALLIADYKTMLDNDPEVTKERYDELNDVGLFLSDFNNTNREKYTYHFEIPKEVNRFHEYVAICDNDGFRIGVVHTPLMSEEARNYMNEDVIAYGGKDFIANVARIYEQGFSEIIFEVITPYQENLAAIIRKNLTLDRVWLVIFIDDMILPWFDIDEVEAPVIENSNFDSIFIFNRLTSEDLRLFYKLQI